MSASSRDILNLESVISDLESVAFGQLVSLMEGLMTNQTFTGLRELNSTELEAVSGAGLGGILISAFGQAAMWLEEQAANAPQRCIAPYGCGL